jgi:hypothetical protein
MDLRRVRAWEWLTGLAGLVLLVALFLPWYEPSDGAGISAWNAFSVTDVVLALCAVAAMTLPALAATQRTAAVPQGWTAMLVYIGLVGAVLAIVRLIAVPAVASPAARGAGAWIGALAAVAILAFDWRSMGDKRFPAAMRPPLDVRVVPTPTPEGERRDLQ